MDKRIFIVKFSSSITETMPKFSVDECTRQNSEAKIAVKWLFPFSVGLKTCMGLVVLLCLSRVNMVNVCYCL